MSNTLPISIVVAALEPGRVYQPQELAEAIAERMTLVAGQSFALFVAGSTEPPYDVGPWAKNGNEWYSFSTDTGNYVPFIVDQTRLRFFVGQTEPDPSVYLFWIELDGNGAPLAVKTYYDGAWTSVYYLKSELYTQAQIDAFFEPTVAGKKQIDWANVINKPDSDLFPFSAKSAAATSIQANAVSVKLAVTTEVYDVGAAYDAPNSRYVAEEAGIYRFNWQAQVDNDTAENTSMTNFVFLIRNSAVNEGSSANNIKDPEGDRWFHNGSADVSMNEGDYVELWGNADDSPGTGFVDFTNIRFSGSLIERTS